MPSSWNTNIGEICDILKTFLPKKILDIGCGFGKYGVLARDILDIQFGRYKKEDWITQIDAIEAVPEFITPMHEYIYDDIQIGKIEEILLLDEIKETYDLILLLEVIEHFSKEKGIDLLNSLIPKTRRLLLSFPAIPIISGYPIGSEFATHKSQWYLSDLQKYILYKSQPIALVLFS